MNDQQSAPEALLSRRAFCTRALGATAAGTVARALQGIGSESNRARGFKSGELREMESCARALMDKHDVPGMSVAIAKEGRLVYAQGFGLADKASEEQVTPSHLFRIASVSKPITATTIFRLIERGTLQLADKVFGAKGLLGIDYCSAPVKAQVAEITVEHLLTHTAGGWQNDETDPMFRHPEMNHRQLINWTVSELPLRHSPGEHYAYSNFGYCVLGRVIEKLTGKAYAEAVRTDVLEPCGIRTMRMAGNTLAERAVREVGYYSQDPDESPYGMNVARMDAHGGWLATAPDLVRFLVHVDKFPTKPDILAPRTIETMTTPSKAAAGYAKGWCVNKYNNWWHSGSLPGTTTIMVRTAQQFCWAALTNTRAKGNLGDDLHRLLWDMVGKISVWPDDDLF